MDDKLKTVSSRSTPPRAADEPLATPLKEKSSLDRLVKCVEDFEKALELAAKSHDKYYANYVGSVLPEGERNYRKFVKDKRDTKGDREFLDSISRCWDNFEKSINSVKYKSEDDRLVRYDFSLFLRDKSDIIDHAKRELRITSLVAEIYIEDTSHENDEASVDERLAALERHARRNHGVGLAQYARLLFPEIENQQAMTQVERSATESHGLTLPTEAPEKYQGLRGPETPPEFVKRVYGEWLGKGLTRAHIRRLDSKLYDAIDNWSRRNEWPADVDLPKLKEQNDRWVDRVRTEGAEAVLGQNASLTDYHRLTSAMGRRKPSGGSPDK